MKITSGFNLFHVFILSFVFNMGVAHISSAEVNEPFNPNMVGPGLFEQTVEGIKEYISILPDEGFRKKKNADNKKKTLINKFDAVDALYRDAHYDEVKDKLLNDIQQKMDGCIQNDQFSDFQPEFDKNDWVIDCSVQIELRDRIGILVSHIGSLLDPETVESCTPSETVNDIFRIGSYNTQFLPDGPLDALYSGCCEDIPDRVQKMADRIIASNYDVIALNETFVESVQNELVMRLRETYPFYVSFVDPVNAIGIGDSGLMLFSRFPFVPLVNPGMAVGAASSLIVAFADHDGDSVWQRWGNVAVTGFSLACAGEDCLAAKGAGLVRVRNPESCRIYNIVFTHLQADDDNPGVRTLQLEKIEKLVLAAVTPPGLDEEEVFIIGDLNINGDHSAEPDRNEWEAKFGAGASGPLTGLGFQDAWEFETHDDSVPMDRRDRGLTSWYGGTKKRLDYILRNDPASSPHDTLCNQHMTIAYNLRHGASHDDPGMGDDGIDLSDHYGINADLNRWAPLCSSKEARVVDNPDYDSRVSTAELDGVITYPGSMQWYRIDEGGTYSVTILEEGFDYRMYQSSNMSVPYQRGGYLWETTPFQYIVPGGVITDPTGGPPIILPDTYHDVEGEMYGVVEPPFYIRIFAVDEDGNPDRGRTGSYTLLVHKHTGRTKEDAIILFPNLLGDQNELSSADDPAIATEVRWFRIDPDVPDSYPAHPDAARAQNLRFYLEAYEPNPYGFQLTSATDADLGSAGGVGHLQIDRNDTSDNGSTLYLQVRPLEESATAHYQVGWATDLTVLHTWHNYRMLVRSVSQTADDCPDLLGEDDDNVTLVMEVFSTLSSGGVLPDHDVTWATPVSPTILAHEFDSGHLEFIDHLVSAVAYLPDERVSFRLYEDDGDSDHPTPEDVIRHEDTDRLFSTIWPWERHVLPENLSGFESTFSPVQQVVTIDEIGVGPCSEGVYTFYYNFSHGRQWMSIE